MRESYNCPSCNLLHTTKLANTTLLACVKCGSEIIINNQTPKIQQITMPTDWSFVKLGTTGTYKESNFSIIGRVRLQLRNDYKTFWCATFEQGKCFYLAESFSSFSVFESTWNNFTGDTTKLRSGKPIKLTTDIRLTGEFVEKCEGISFQGEVGPWKNFSSGFFVIQASNNQGNIAIYFIKPNKECVFIAGEKTDPKKLKLENIVDYHDWR